MVTNVKFYLLSFSRRASQPFFWWSRKWRLGWWWEYHRDRKECRTSTPLVRRPRKTVWFLPASVRHVSQECESGRTWICASFPKFREGEWQRPIQPLENLLLGRFQRVQRVTITPDNFSDDGYFRLFLERFFVIFWEMGLIGGHWRAQIGEWWVL